MTFSRLFVENFRKFRNADFTFSSNGITLISGNNGSGKSTILEALHLLTLGRSHRDARFSELIRQDGDTAAPYFRVQADRPSGSSRSLAYLGGAAIVYKDGDKPVRRSDFIGHPPTVLFSPDELLILTGPPDRRRRWMDRILSQENAEYLGRIRRYTRTIEERNSLLRNAEYGSIDPAALLAFDETLAQDGTEIVASRRNLIQDLQSRIAQQLTDLGADTLAGRLRPELVVTAGTDLLGELLAARSQDIAARHTTVGPHRDDLRVMDRGLPAAATLSQGELRILTLALKLFESARLAAAHTGVPGILLCDDVFSELDDIRKRAVSKFLLSFPGQVLLTSCVSPPEELRQKVGGHISMD